jgi:hypothetical protein
MGGIPLTRFSKTPMLLQAGERVEEKLIKPQKATKAQKLFPGLAISLIRFITQFIHFSATVYKDFLNKCSNFRTR